jgi:hypothetical protein
MMYYNSDPKPEKTPKKPRKPLRYKPKGTEQIDLMREVFKERGGCCEITGEDLDWSPSCVHHILPKGSHPRFKLYKPNLIVIHPELHYAIHNCSKEYVLQIWPKAIVLYDRAEQLKIEYNTKEPII